MNQPPWMAHAWADLGLRESPGSASNPRITAYFRTLGHNASDDATAWCAAFVGACLERTGLRSTRSLAARSYLEWGTPIEQPTLGAVTILTRGSDPALGHVGFLVGETPSHVILLGGNQSDGVSTAAFERTRVLGYRLPSAATVAPLPSPGSPSLKSAADDKEFAAALDLVLEHEGGYTDDPFDPGGPTNRGITIAVFARELGARVTAETIGDLKAALRRIPHAQVRQIYLERYWHPARCPDLPPCLALFHFDAAVNQGVAGSTRMLQQALNVDADGEIGPVTLAAAHACDPLSTLARYAEIRRRHYRSLATFWRFGRGWLRRVDATLDAAQTLCAAARETTTNPTTSAQKDQPTMPEPYTHPATPSQSPDPATPKWWGESLTIWGTLLTTLSTVAPAIFAVFGIDLSPDLVAKLGRDAVLAVQAVGGLMGTIMTIVGRARARAPLERRPLNLHV